MTQYQISDEDNEIFNLFHNRCVRCSSVAVTIHEIIPRSHGESSMRQENRVAICADCHEWAHKIGTKNSIPILQELRKKFLLTYA